jgi:hypothetical protein
MVHAHEPTTSAWGDYDTWISHAVGAGAEDGAQKTVAFCITVALP